MSPQPWEPREPGWGTHTIEYRGRDAAGNVGATKQFRVTVLPEAACTNVIAGQQAGPLEVTTGTTCLNGATVSGNVSVSAGASLVANNATIKGSVSSTGANSIELDGRERRRRVHIDGTAGSVALFGVNVTQDVVLANNQGAAAGHLAGNRMRALSCTGNRTAPTNAGSANSVRNPATGQCAR